MAILGGNVTGGRVAVVSIFDSNFLFKILVSALKNGAEILAFCFVHFESNLAVSQLLECAIPPALLSVTKSLSPFSSYCISQNMINWIC